MDRGDRVQLQQVVLNLIVNALEAFANGTSTDRRVTVSCARPGQSFVEISVIDNGMGFNGAEQSAFEPFNTTKQDGMGLGLSIARSIVDTHGGIIRASSNLEGGATVYFRLPLAHHSTT
jgi:signal transduction histidine kinase